MYAAGVATADVTKGDYDIKKGDYVGVIEAASAPGLAAHNQTPQSKSSKTSCMTLERPR